MREQLTALILHFDGTRGEYIQFLQGRFFQQTQTQRCELARSRLDACMFKGDLNRFA